MLRPDDVAVRLAHLGLDPAVYHLGDIAHDIADTYPRGVRPTDHSLRRIAERNTRGVPVTTVTLETVI